MLHVGLLPDIVVAFPRSALHLHVLHHKVPPPNKESEFFGPVAAGRIGVPKDILASASADDRLPDRSDPLFILYLHTLCPREPRHDFSLNNNDPVPARRDPTTGDILDLPNSE